jgi:hypothetical protein
MSFPRLSSRAIANPQPKHPQPGPLGPFPGPMTRAPICNRPAPDSGPEKIGDGQNLENPRENVVAKYGYTINCL